MCIYNYPCCNPAGCYTNGFPTTTTYAMYYGLMPFSYGSNLPQRGQANICRATTVWVDTSLCLMQPEQVALSCCCPAANPLFPAHYSRATIDATLPKKVNSML